MTFRSPHQTRGWRAGTGRVNSDVHPPSPNRSHPRCPAQRDSCNNTIESAWIWFCIFLNVPIYFHICLTSDDVFDLAEDAFHKRHFIEYIYNILYIWEQNVTTYRSQTLPDFVRCDLFIYFILHSWPMMIFKPWPPVVTCVVREFHQHWVGPTDEARYATGGPDCPMTAGYTSCTCSGSWDVSWFSAIYS